MILLRYKTSYWIPPIAAITLRTKRNDWKDLPGRYELGSWTFELPARDFCRHVGGETGAGWRDLDERSKPHLHCGGRRDA